jgi:hypothetical protein
MGSASLDSTTHRLKIFVKRQQQKCNKNGTNLTTNTVKY